MASRDKLVVELILLLFVILILYIFSSEFHSFFNHLMNEFEYPPVKSFFWFMEIISDLFGYWIFCAFSYMISAGILYLIASRKY